MLREVLNLRPSSRQKSSQHMSPTTTWAHVLRLYISTIKYESVGRYVLDSLARSVYLRAVALKPETRGWCARGVAGCSCVTTSLDRTLAE
jgi:hypothetical protein